MYLVLAQNEAVAMIRHLQLIFDIVRLVDVSFMIQYRIDEEGGLVPEDYKCYAVWKKGDRCENCISAKAYAVRGRMTKYEFIGSDIYYVVAKYIIVGDKEYVLEIVSKVTDELLFGAFGKENIIKTILSYNEKIYKDSLTGAYNRLYYEEQLQNLRNTPSVAMLDIDNFKRINDTYGHAAGDEVLRGVVGAVRANIRSGDVVVRYGGDEFLLIFNGMDSESFKRKLEELRERINELVIEGYPEIKVTVSIGGCHVNEPGENSVRAADKLLYRAKRMRNAVCCCDDGSPAEEDAPKGE